tara:strand:+ start:337 stop:1545 length:1209 start_codon:yes stop_codon:yes gene_type:complete
MRLYIFEDFAINNLVPITYTRPGFEIRCGTFTCIERLIRNLPKARISLIVRESIAEFVREKYPEFDVNPRNIEDGIWMLGNVLWLKKDIDYIVKSNTQVFKNENKIIAANLNAKEGIDWINKGGPLKNRTLNKDFSTKKLSSRVINYLWDVVLHNPSQISEDYFFFKNEENKNDFEKKNVIAPERIYADPLSHINSNVILDATNGEIIIEKHAIIKSFSYIEGPAFIGENTLILPYSYLRQGTSIGPFCNISGELSQTIIQSWTNKSHYGYLGHSYIGEWVNLGAGTTSSNLKNNYSDIRIIINGSIINTKIKKLGCFIGDYSKTSIGTCLNTGTVIGPSCNIVTKILPPKFLPPFTWFINDKSSKYEWDSFINSMEIIRKRKGMILSNHEEAMIKNIYFDF